MILLLGFLVAHKVSILAAVGGIYLFLADSQPPLSPNAGYWKTWAYHFFQSTAANSRGLRRPIIADPATTTSSVTAPTNVGDPATTLIKGK